MKKKLKKALMAGAALYGASKLMGARNKSLLAGTEDGKGGIDTIVKAKQAMTSDDAYSPAKAMKKKSLFQKILNIGPGPNKSSSPADILGGIDGFGLGEMDGAKYGKMINAKDGVYVTAKCKNGRNKATKIT